MIDERNKQDSHRAKVRIGVAAALLVTAIVILTVLNQRRAEKVVEEPELPAMMAQTSLSSTDIEAPAAIPEEAPINTAEPEASVAATPPPPPVPGELPHTAASPLKKDSATPVVEEESAGASLAAPPFVATAAKTLSKPQMSAAAVQSPAGTAQSTAPTPAQSKSLAPKVFEVQLGVFTDIDNAKQLQMKLAASGIPSHTETRVQIGPFKSREEADRAREKLKKLGISSVVLGK